MMIAVIGIFQIKIPEATFIWKYLPENIKPLNHGLGGVSSTARYLAVLHLHDYSWTDNKTGSTIFV